MRPLARNLFIVSIAALLSIGAGCKKKAPSIGSNEASLSVRINPGHTGAISGGSLKAPLRRRWNATFNGFLRYPIVTKDAVFIVATTRSSIDLHAFDVQTGSAIWPAVHLNDSVIFGASAAYDGRVVYVMYQDLAQKAWTVAVDSDTGHILWNNHDQGYAMPQGDIVAALGGVFFDSVVPVKVREDTGVVEWFASGNVNSGTPAVTPDGLWTVGQGCVKKWSLDSSPQWTKGGCHYQTQGTVVVGEGLILAPAEEKAVALLNDNGEEIRRVPVVGYPIALHAGKVFSPSYVGSNIQATDVTTGESVWSAEDVDGIFGGPLVINGTLYSTNKQGTLFAHDERTGELLWTDYAARTFDPSNAMDLGTNGDVLIVQTKEGIAAYESDPSPQVQDDESFKAACQSSDAGFYVEGTPARVNQDGTSLNDGAYLGTTPVAVPMAYVDSSMPTEISAVAQKDSDGFIWGVGVTSDQPLAVGTYSPANYRSTGNPNGTGTRLRVVRHNDTVSLACDIADGKFEITKLERDPSGLVVKSLSMAFVYHCNRQVAATRGCINFSR